MKAQRNLPGNCKDEGAEKFAKAKRVKAFRNAQGNLIEAATAIIDAHTENKDNRNKNINPKQNPNIKVTV